MIDADFGNKVAELHQRYSAGTHTSVANFLEAVRKDIPLRPLMYSAEIVESNEELLEIPLSMRLKSPHPYVSAGAPYGELSPWHVRATVLKKLEAVQAELQQKLPGHTLGVYDAFRPVAVQAYMIDLERDRFAKEAGASGFAELSDPSKNEVNKKVYSIWARASDDPAKPSPHSTGGVVDLTIVTPDGTQLEMGSAIDEYPPKSLPSFYSSDSSQTGKAFHQNRRLLQQVMESQDFVRLPHEWWHFSYGDQQWAFQQLVKSYSTSIKAIYGSVC